MVDMPLIMHRGLYGAPRLAISCSSEYLKENFYNCDDVAKICKVGQRWTYSMKHSGRWHITYLHCRVFCTLSIHETTSSDISRARYTESALVACLHSIQSSVGWIDRLVLVPVQRACACPTCSFHVPAKNPHRKGHFAKQLCLCTLSTPPPPVPWNTERSVIISTEPEKCRRQNLSDKHTNLHRKHRKGCSVYMYVYTVHIILGSGVT